MLTALHERKGAQLLIGLLIGIAFGFLLQKGGVTKHDVILGQLLFEDFTVLKIMLSAVITGMIGVYLLRSLGVAQLHPKPGSFGTSVVGGLIFGLGFALLGYCPGIVAGAIGEGWLDALLGGAVGILIGAGLFAALFPQLQRGILTKGDFGTITFPELLRVNAWAVVVPVALLIAGLLWWIESAGFGAQSGY
jgi:hypothetical protein